MPKIEIFAKSALHPGMQSVWASTQQGARAVRRCGAGLVELKKWVTEAAKHVVLLVQQLVFGVEKKSEFLHKLTWLVLGGDPAARSHRVEQFIAL